jgi:hypothetical protein
MLALAACAEGRSKADGATVMEQQSGLSAVRLMGPRPALEKMAAAAAAVGWTEKTYDKKGRLILRVPANYTSDQFVRLLEAVNPHASALEGLQMLGPNGGPVDDQGIEHPDD